MRAKPKPCCQIAYVPNPAFNRTRRHAPTVWRAAVAARRLTCSLGALQCSRRSPSGVCDSLPPSSFSAVSLRLRPSRPRIASTSTRRVEVTVRLPSQASGQSAWLWSFLASARWRSIFRRHLGSAAIGGVRQPSVWCSAEPSLWVQMFYSVPNMAFNRTPAYAPRSPMRRWAGAG